MPRRVYLLQDICESLDAPAALAPHLNLLFANVHALGSQPRTIARLLASARVSRGARVLDLGCGKGAAAVEIARAIGCRVLGLDACETFLVSARELAARRHVPRLCTFRAADINDRSSLPRARFDAAIMLGLSPFASAVPLLRSFVRAGGVYVIDDAVLNYRHPRAKAVLGMPTRKEAESLVASLGDTILSFQMPPPSVTRRLNASLYRAISRAARALAREHPRLRGAIRAFLANQRRENAALVGPVRPSSWLIRRV